MVSTTPRWAPDFTAPASSVPRLSSLDSARDDDEARTCRDQRLRLSRVVAAAIEKFEIDIRHPHDVGGGGKCIHLLDIARLVPDQLGPAIRIERDGDRSALHPRSWPAPGLPPGRRRAWSIRHERLRSHRRGWSRAGRSSFGTPSPRHRRHIAARPRRCGRTRASSGARCASHIEDRPAKPRRGRRSCGRTDRSRCRPRTLPARRDAPCRRRC